MKTTKLKHRNILTLILIFSASITFAQVGINTTNPTETLHVNGNVRIDGALMPGNTSGNTDQILLSQGPGNNPAWGPGFLNTGQVSNIGKFFIGPFDITANYLTLTVTDPNMTNGSTLFVTFVGDLPEDPSNPGQPFYGDLVLTPEARNGEFKVHIANYTGYAFSNLQLSFVAFYE